MAQRRERRDLPQTVDVVAVANLVERRDEFGGAHGITDALKTERMSLRERTRDQHVPMSQSERQRVLPGKVDVGLVEQDDAALRAAESVELSRRIAASARRVGRRDK